MTQPQTVGPKISGYRELSSAEIEAVNTFKDIEANALDWIDALKGDPSLTLDPRWLSIGITHLEQGFMALNRAIMRPQRRSAAFTKIPARQG